MDLASQLIIMTQQDNGQEASRERSTLELQF